MKILSKILFVSVLFLYITTASSYTGNLTYLGCFKDDVPSIVNNNSKHMLHLGAMTISYCISFCGVDGYKYAVLKGGICLCDSVFPLTTIQIYSESYCTQACPGNINTVCGGPQQVSVYELYFSPSETTVNQLVTDGKDTIQIVSTTMTSKTISGDTTSIYISAVSKADAAVNQTVTAEEQTTPYAIAAISIETVSIDTTSNNLFSSSNAETTVNQDLTGGVQTLQSVSNTINTEILYGNAPANDISSTEQGFIISQSAKSSSTTCLCTCTNAAITNLTEIIQKLKNAIAIDKKHTSLYINSKISVHDHRISATTIGCIGVFCLCFPITVILAIDIGNFRMKSRKYECKT